MVLEEWGGCSPMDQRLSPSQPTSHLREVTDMVSNFHLSRDYNLTGQSLFDDSFIHSLEQTAAFNWDIL